MLITVLKYVINESICSTLHHHHHNHNSVPNDDAPPSPKACRVAHRKEGWWPQGHGSLQVNEPGGFQFSFQKKTTPKETATKKMRKTKKNKGEWNTTFMLKIPFKQKQNKQHDRVAYPRHFMGNWLGCPAVMLCRRPWSKSCCANVAQWLLLRGPRLWSISPNQPPTV